MGRVTKHGRSHCFLSSFEAREGSHLRTTSGRVAVQPLNSCDRDARHNVHSVRSLDETWSANGSLSARDIRSRSRRTSASGRNTGRTCGGTLASSSEAVARCLRASPIS
jgi:hypothetical protein